MVTGNSVDVEVEPISRADQLREAVEILVTEENILVDDEIDEVEPSTWSQTSTPTW